MLTPLQMGLPGAPELLLVLLVFLLLGAIAGYWVYRDATRRRSAWAWQWGVVVAVLCIPGLVPGLLAVIIYLLVRGDAPGSHVI